MKRIDPTVLRETGYIAAFTLLLSVLMEAVFLLVGAWDLTVLFGNLLGALSAVANFFFMGIGVQKALGRDADGAKRVVKLSQSTRYLLLVAVALIGYFVPAFHVVAVVVSFLFPRIAIMFRPLFGKKDQ